SISLVFQVLQHQLRNILDAPVALAGVQSHAASFQHHPAEGTGRGYRLGARLGNVTGTDGFDARSALDIEPDLSASAAAAETLLPRQPHFRALAVCEPIEHRARRFGLVVDPTQVTWIMIRKRLDGAGANLERPIGQF